MMGHMSGSNLVMKEVNGTPGVKFVVGTIDCVEGSPDKVVVGILEVGNIDIRVLKPEMSKSEMWILVLF